MILAVSGHRQAGSSLQMQTRAIEAVDRYWNETPEGEQLLIVAGGALGWDQEIMSAALDRQVPYEIYLPFPAEIFTEKWSALERDHYAYLEQHATKVHVLASRYANRFYQARNEAMASRGARIDLYWDGRTRGGTWNMIRYGIRIGRPMFNWYDKKPVLEVPDAD